MFDLTVSASRNGDTIHAIVRATLPDGCHEAQITDIYPGGTIVHVIDPGHAEVFVTFSKRDGPCTQAISVWTDSRDIPHQNDYREVVVHAEFEGEHFDARGEIQSYEPARSDTNDPGADPAQSLSQSS